MRLKGAPNRARIVGLRPELVFAAFVYDELAAAAGVPGQLREITAGLDSTHTPGSRHYIGAAVDLASHGIPGNRYTFLLDLQAALGPDFLAILENAGQPNEHIHVELHVVEPFSPSTTEKGAH